MIGYPLDIRQPYQFVTMLENNQCLISGTKTVKTHKDGAFQGAEFGGVGGLWDVKLSDLLTKEQKRNLRYIRRTEGEEIEQIRFRELVAAEIAGHLGSIES